MNIHCDANATGRTATDWGFDYLPCQTTRGLRSLMDRDGVTRFYCAAPGHRENVERRFGLPTDEQIRIQRAIERISADFDEEVEFDRESQPEFNGSFR